MTSTKDIREALPNLGWTSAINGTNGPVLSDAPECSDKSLTTSEPLGIVGDMQELDAMMKPEDAAKFIGVHPKTLGRWRLAGSGGPPWVQLSERIIRYRASDLSAWLNAKTAT